MKGNLSDIPFADLLQLICRNEQQGLLTVKHEKREAQVYFVNGRIVHAILEDKEGKEVIYQILNWETGSFNFKSGVLQDKVTITMTWQALLLAGAKNLDEGEYEKEQASLRRNNPTKEKKMNVKRLNQVVQDLKEDLGEGLVATDNWKTGDAQSLAGYNSRPEAVALFNEITRSIGKTLKGAGFPGLGSYYMINLENNMVIMVIVCGDFQEGMLVDLSKTTLGLLISIALPKVLKGLEEAVK